MVKQPICKRSERICAKWNELFKNKNKQINELIHIINSCDDFRDKISYIIKIYEIITLELDILIQFYTINFLIVVFEKGIVIQNHFILEVEKQNNLTKFYNQYNKIFTIYQNKISNYLLQHLYNNTKDIIKDKDKECPICLENLRPCNKIKTHCNHIFHKICLFRHLINNHSCPLCRENMDFVL
jgi:hypothetical protein